MDRAHQRLFSFVGARGLGSLPLRAQGEAVVTRGVRCCFTHLLRLLFARIGQRYGVLYMQQYSQQPHHMIQPAMAVFSQYVPSEQPEYGIFEVHFSNAKKRGKGRPIQYCTCYGSVYPNGHTHLDTQEVRIANFLTFRGMRAYLESFGSVRIVWLTAPIVVSKYDKEPS